MKFFWAFFIVASLIVFETDARKRCFPVTKPSTTTTTTTTSTTTTTTVAPCRDTLTAGQCMQMKENIFSCNGCFRIYYQPEGNVVIYPKNLGYPHQIWYTADYNQPTSNLACLSNDGQFILMDSQNQTVWSTPNAASNATYGFYAKIEYNAEFIIYDGQDIVWRSNKTRTPC